MVKVQDEGDVNSWRECLHGDCKFLMYSSCIIHHKGNADPEKWAKIIINFKIYKINFRLKFFIYLKHIKT